MTDLNVLKHDDLPGIEIFLKWITPEMADEFLATNSDGQRKLNEDVYLRYAEDMADANWLFTGAPILFDNKGKLIDGQHRLNAIAECGEKQLCLIVTGLDTDVMKAVDAGRKRTYATYLQMVLERPSFTMQASIIRAYWYWTIGNYGDKGVSRIAVPSEYVHSIPTIAQMEKAREECERTLEVTFTHASQFAQRAYTQLPRITTTVWGLVWILLTEYDIDLREQFFHELLKEPKSTSIQYGPNALRHRLMKQQQPLKRMAQLHMVLRSFNAWQDGQLLQVLSSPNAVSFNTLAQLPAKESR